LDNDLSLTLFAGGTFEPNEFALLDRVLQPGMVFVDGGANEGVYSVFAAARVGPMGRVIAVEPSSRELARLRENVALNRLSNVDIVEAALAERSGSAPLLIAEKLHAGQNTLGAFAYDTVKSVGAQDVAVKTLDEIVLQCALSRLDILKLDLEGAEIRALSGAGRVLAEMRPLVLVEVSEASLAHQGGSARALFELLEAADYVLLAIDDETGEPVPLRSNNRPPSDNVVAVHTERDWGLLPR
jgi:FkbM family methyltransferase